VTFREFFPMPFADREPSPGIRITGAVGRGAGALVARFAVRGNLPEIVLPVPDGRPWRKERLWEETCREPFLGTRRSPRYWEINLSPAGHWNVYRFASYRREMEEEAVFTEMPFAVVADGEAVEAGICAVIRNAAGGTSHWTLLHPGPRPDFHRREGFAVLLPAE
jgi:hypothetical protein